MKEGLECSDLLQVVASSLDTLEPVLLEGFESKEDLVACLKASANVPRIAGEPLQHRWAPPKQNKTSERTDPIIVGLLKANNTSERTDNTVWRAPFKTNNATESTDNTVGCFYENVSLERSVRWKLEPTPSCAQEFLWRPADLSILLHAIRQHEGVLQIFTSPGV